MMGIASGRKKSTNISLQSRASPKADAPDEPNTVITKIDITVNARKNPYDKKLDARIAQMRRRIVAKEYNMRLFGLRGPS